MSLCSSDSSRDKIGNTIPVSGLLAFISSAYSLSTLANETISIPNSCHLPKKHYIHSKFFVHHGAQEHCLALATSSTLIFWKLCKMF